MRVLFGEVVGAGLHETKVVDRGYWLIQMWQKFDMQPSVGPGDQASWNYFSRHLPDASKTKLAIRIPWQ